MSVIARCWIWTARDPASGQVSRGVMFHEPEASRAYVSAEEYVPASQLRGAVEAGNALYAVLDGVWSGKDGGYDQAEVEAVMRQWLDATLGGR